MKASTFNVLNTPTVWWVFLLCQTGSDAFSSALFGFNKRKKSVLTKETCITFMAGRKKKSEGRGQIKEILTIRIEMWRTMCDMTTIENDLRVRLFLFLRIHRDKKNKRKNNLRNKKDLKWHKTTKMWKQPQTQWSQNVHKETKKNAKPLETDVKQTQRQRQGPEKDTKKSDIKQPHTDQS